MAADYSQTAAVDWLQDTSHRPQDQKPTGSLRIIKRTGQFRLLAVPQNAEDDLVARRVGVEHVDEINGAFGKCEKREDGLTSLSVGLLARQKTEAVTWDRSWEDIQMVDKESLKETSTRNAVAPAMPPGTEEKVPEWAENMEHTLRRLVREKEKQRAKNPGLYK